MRGCRNELHCSQNGILFRHLKVFCTVDGQSRFLFSGCKPELVSDISKNNKAIQLMITIIPNRADMQSQINLSPRQSVFCPPDHRIKAELRL